MMKELYKSKSENVLHEYLKVKKKKDQNHTEVWNTDKVDKFSKKIKININICSTNPQFRIGPNNTENEEKKIVPKWE